MKLPRGLKAKILAGAPKAPARRRKAVPRSGGLLPCVEVPVPPSANNLFPTRRGSLRRFPSRAYTAWKMEAYQLLAALAAPKGWPVEVWLTLTGAGVNQARDVANIEKALVDGLVACGVLPDDSLPYVVGVHLLYRPDDGAPRVAVRLSEPGG